MSGDDRGDSPADGAVDLIRFFRALGPEARREYDALATLDREYGENVRAERIAASAKGTKGEAPR